MFKLSVVFTIVVKHSHMHALTLVVFAYHPAETQVAYLLADGKKKGGEGRLRIFSDHDGSPEL